MDFDVALIGFGEAGLAFAIGGGWGDRAAVYDRKTDAPATRRRKIEDYAAASVIDSRSAAEAAGAANLVLSLVTADQALAAAKAAASGLRNGAFYCDGNSVAPSTKRKAAKVIEAAGAHYIDLAILAPVNPARLGVPLLVSGPSAEAACQALGGLGFMNIRAAGRDVGRASSIKMIRSVIVKGIEALSAECVLAATRAGVLDEVLTSLDASEKAIGWRERADYNLDRMLVHGLRRAAEMREVAKTLKDLGVEPAMTNGTVTRQYELGTLGALNACPASPPQTGLETKLEIIQGKEWKAA